MKKLFLICLNLLFLQSFLPQTLAQPYTEFAATISYSPGEKIVDGFKSKAEYSTIEANYLKGLDSGNFGLIENCVYFLGEIKSEKASIPLMKIFRETQNNGLKLLAAWSLLKIGNSIGAHLVKQEYDNGKDPDISCMLEWLYKDYSLKANGKAF